MTTGHREFFDRSAVGDRARGQQVISSMRLKKIYLNSIALPSLFAHGLIEFFERPGSVFPDRARVEDEKEESRYLQ